MNKIKNYLPYFVSFFFTLISIPVILLIQQFVPNNSVSLKDSLLFVSCIIIIFVAAYMEFARYKSDKEKEADKQVEEQNKRAKTVLSQIRELTDRKTANIRENTYSTFIIEKDWPYFYNVHNYLYEVCDNLKHTISKITSIQSDYIDVSLIYKYSSESDWKWLAGKSGTSEAVNLNDFVRNRDTLYNYVLSHKQESPIFCNDKTKSHIYKPGRRDTLFEKKGSYYAMPVTFYNNQEALVEAILLISSYGDYFLPLSASEDDEKEFKKMLAHEVVPYYISIIQNELAALYLRHNLEKMNCITAYNGHLESASR